ncbi:MAG TPA: exodeoxyribonuclease VII small subunit [Candidatus Cloacimonas sp.]|nr:exodeoxyribonuclease small subunit [Candidatus Cloacimonadota bacterium]HCX73121.1 exodeoxyribonuclease VII small subunit [Candidatus Cloacimonas sp.]
MKDITFEESLKKLEEIVSKLENGVDDLDELVALFEEGSKLVDNCYQKLNKIENKIEILNQKQQETESERDRDE